MRGSFLGAWYSPFLLETISVKESPNTGAIPVPATSMWLILLVLVIIFELVADVLSKEWSLKPKLSFLLGGIIFYLIANVAWLFSLRFGSGLARGVSIFSVACTIMAIIIGLVFYKESISNLQIAGIILGIISLLLIFWNDIF